MGDFIYEGEHSIGFDGRNTWDYWHMAPSSRPFVAPPKVKTEYVDIPGANGQLDYTEVLTGGVRYGQRTGNWQFLVDNGYWDWPVLYSDLLEYLHGKRHRIVLADDPGYYYIGRTELNVNFGAKDYSTVTINYNLDPLKYPIESTAQSDWLWNELFSNTIIYGKFNVHQEKTRNIINTGSAAKDVTVTLSSPMDIIFGGSTISLPAGTNSNALTIQPGDNVMKFVGSGQVTIDYSVGGKL